MPQSYRKPAPQPSLSAPPPFPPRLNLRYLQRLLRKFTPLCYIPQHSRVNTKRTSIPLENVSFRSMFSC